MMFKYNWAVREDWFKRYESESELLEKRAGGVGGITTYSASHEAGSHPFYAILFLSSFNIQEFDSSKWFIVPNSGAWALSLSFAEQAGKIQPGGNPCSCSGFPRKE
ncbi:hypothetical protein G8C92_26905 [Paenibacillus donghaensis]|uniref:hypothetical protein n=1 Tax=Paenibacillus donghaensis TaxID=414771 RepID=UPI0018832135|nr:hypothetical protein [Paenibacillus donghaensis]